MSETVTPGSVGGEGASDSNAGVAEKRKLTGVPLLIVALGVVLFVQALFVLSYIGALHHPKPHQVAFGVVGTSPLPTVVGKQFSLKTTQYASGSAVLAAIDQRKIDGAFVAGPAGAKLIVVPAAGAAGAAALGTAFTAAAAAGAPKRARRSVDLIRAGRPDVPHRQDALRLVGGTSSASRCQHLCWNRGLPSDGAEAVLAPTARCRRPLPENSDASCAGTRDLMPPARIELAHAV
jgi:hypothetical protein